MLSMVVAEIDWPLHRPFRIARATQTSIPAIEITLTDAAGNVGHGEALGVDYAGETPATMVAQLEAIRDAIEVGISLADAQVLLPAGGARNALDCALWDLRAKASGVRAWRAAGLAPMTPVATAFTIGIMAEPDLRAAVRARSDFAVLKVKTDAARGLDPVRLVHEEAPHARLIVDANEGWGEAELRRFAGSLAALGVVLLEQPVTVADDALLRRVTLPVPVAADEAFNDRRDLAGLCDRYQVVNIKLDKTGGLTEALACAHAARAHRFGVMVGCMAGSSLSMAPATLVAQFADFVDLDGPLLQIGDIVPAIAYRDGMIEPPLPALWG